MNQEVKPGSERFRPHPRCGPLLRTGRLRLSTHGLTAEERRVIEAGLGRAPNPLEWALFGALWSEHCSYKHTKPLLGMLPTHGSGVVAGPGEGAGAVAWRDGWAVVFKLESHNHPSYVAPFDGAATGVGGILRDVFAMGAEVLAVAGALAFDVESATRSALATGVADGLKAYAERFGVPFGALSVVLDARYRTNPLVNALAVGRLARDKLVLSAADRDDLVFIYAGRPTDFDGVHGAAFASKSFAGAGANARAGNAIPVRVPKADPETGRRLYEATLAVIGRGWAYAVQDMGAAGLLSASAEMAAKGGRGATLYLDRVPRAFAEERGAPRSERAPEAATAITPEAAEVLMLSETQERMLYAVRREDADAVLALLGDYGIPAAAVGEVRADGRYVLQSGDRVLADVPVRLLVDGVPLHDLRERLSTSAPASGRAPDDGHVAGVPGQTTPDERLAEHFGDHRRWAGAALFGRRRLSAVGLQAVPDLPGGVAYTVVAAPKVVEERPDVGTAALVVWGAVRLALVGAMPLGVTNNLNFGDPSDPRVARDIVRSIEGLAAGARALDLPVVSGNVSLYNATSGRSIPPTPVVGLVGDVPDDELLSRAPTLTTGDVLAWASPWPHGSSAERTSFETTSDDGDTPDEDVAPDVLGNPPRRTALRSWLAFLAEMRRAGLIKGGAAVEEGGILGALADVVQAAWADDAPTASPTETEAMKASMGEDAPPSFGLRWLLAPERLAALIDAHPLSVKTFASVIVVVAADQVPALEEAAAREGFVVRPVARVADASAMGAFRAAAETGCRRWAVRA